MIVTTIRIHSNGGIAIVDLYPFIINCWLPSGKRLHSYWKWQFIVSFPINSMVDLSHSYVNVYQAGYIPIVFLSLSLVAKIPALNGTWGYPPSSAANSEPQFEAHLMNSWMQNKCVIAYHIIYIMHISYRCAYMEENTNTNTSSNNNNNNNTNNNVTTTSLEMMVLRKWDTLPMVDWSIKVISLGQTMFPKFLWLMIWIFERKTCFNRNTCFYTVLK